jgi:hypothetical protein
MQNMVSYESKKNGTRPYSGNPSQTFQEGMYKGAKQHYDSYAAYRAPPTERPRGPRSSNEATARLWEDGYPLRNSNSSSNLTASQRTNVTGEDNFEPESHLETYPYTHEMADPQRNTVYNDAVYYSQPASQYPYQQYQISGSNVYQNPAAASAPSLGTLSSEEEYTHYSQHVEYSQHDAYSQQLQYYQLNGYSYQQHQTHSEHKPLYTQASHTGPPQIAVQTVNPFEGRSQSLTSRSFNKSGRRSPQPNPHYMSNVAQNSATSTRSMSINGMNNLNFLYFKFYNII